jgi:hypothetical protein
MSDNIVLTVGLVLYISGIVLYVVRNKHIKQSRKFNFTYFILLLLGSQYTRDYLKVHFYPKLWESFFMGLLLMLVLVVLNTLIAKMIVKIIEKIKSPIDEIEKIEEDL